MSLLLLSVALAGPVLWSEIPSNSAPFIPPAERDFIVYDKDNNTATPVTGVFQGEFQGAIVQSDNHWCGVGGQWCWDPAPIIPSLFNTAIFPGGGDTGMTTKSYCAVDSTNYSAPAGSVYRWILNDCQVYQRWQSATASFQHAWWMEAKIGRAFGWFRYYCPNGGQCEAEPESNYPPYSFYTSEPGDWYGEWINTSPSSIAGFGTIEED